MNLKETCQMTDQEFEERTKTRAEEMKAVSETAERMLAAAAKTHPRLAALASRVRLDNFKKVSEDIDGMVADLQKEKQDDIKMKDFCVDSLNKNEMARELKRRDIEQLDAEIADLTEMIEELTKAIAALQAEIAEMQVQLKRAGEDRELENNDFQKTVAEQRETQKLLTSALNVLKGFYDKAFLQSKAKQPAGPPPPPSFKKYENSSGAGGVMGMIEQIISDAATMEKDAIKAETDAQKANEAIEAKTRDITNKSEEKAEKEADKVAAETAKGTALNEQQELMNENADLHKSCDFLLQNFELRQAALEQEMESLEQVKSVLHGSSMGFMQKH